MKSAHPYRVKVYRGAGRDAAPASRAGRDITYTGDDAVVCEGCGASVRPLASGRPKGHAPGGLATNTRAGRYKCEGSGNEGSG